MGQAFRVAGLAALLNAACGAPPQEIAGHATASPERPSLQVFRGTVVYGHEVREFRPCGTAGALWVIDRSGLLWQLHQQLAPGQRPYEEIFAVLRGRREPAPAEGFGVGYSGLLRIEAVLYAGVEGLGCTYDWGGFHYRAYGNEPFWNAQMSPAGLRLRRSGQADLEWRELAREPSNGAMRFRGTGVPRATLSITRSDCRDSMSGAYFALTATLRFGGETLHGCALQGTEPTAP